MEEVLRIIVNGIMDAVEGFFEALVIPTAKFTLYAFFVSLGFLGVSVCCEVFEVFSFVSWEEATTCSIILLCIVLIDTSTRSSIASYFGKLKNLSKKNVYHETNEDVEADYNE